MPDFNASVLITTHNRAHCLPRCIESILAQRLRPRQIIVVDDGSTDGTVEAIAPCRDRLEYYWQPNGGKSTAINNTIHKVTGDYLWIFDDDDVALPTALESHARAFSENPAASFTYSSFYNGEADATGALSIVAEHRIPDIPENLIFVELLFGNFTGGQPATVVKTRSYRDVGPFEETLLRSQDYEMLLRLSRRFTGAGVQEFTFIKQIDSQVCVPGIPNTDPNDRTALWRAYDTEIFLKLHRELAPWDYVPDRATGNCLTAAEERLFRLRRMAMMARQDLWDQALEDLSAFVSLFLSTDEAEPSAEERRLLWRATSMRWGDVPRLNRYKVAALRRIVSDRRCASIRASLRHGMWQSAVACLRRRRPAAAARILPMTAKLLP